MRRKENHSIFDYLFFYLNALVSQSIFPFNFQKPNFSPPHARKVVLPLAPVLPPSIPLLLFCFLFLKIVERHNMLLLFFLFLDKHRIHAFVDFLFIISPTFQLLIDDFKLYNLVTLFRVIKIPLNNQLTFEV